MLWLVLGRTFDISVLILALYQRWIFLSKCDYILSNWTAYFTGNSAFVYLRTISIIFVTSLKPRLKRYDESNTVFMKIKADFHRKQLRKSSYSTYCVSFIFFLGKNNLHSNKKSKVFFAQSNNRITWYRVYLRWCRLFHLLMNKP